MLRWLFASFSTKAWELYCDDYLLSYLQRLWALCYDELNFPYKWAMSLGVQCCAFVFVVRLLLQIWHGKWFCSYFEHMPIPNGFVKFFWAYAIADAAFYLKIVYICLSSVFFYYCNYQFFSTTATMKLWLTSLLLIISFNWKHVMCFESLVTMTCKLLWFLLKQY